MPYALAENESAGLDGSDSPDRAKRIAIEPAGLHVERDARNAVGVMKPIHPSVGTQCENVTVVVRRDGLFPGRRTQRDRNQGAVPELINSVASGHPDVALSILQNRVDDV